MFLPIDDGEILIYVSGMGPRWVPNSTMGAGWEQNLTRSWRIWGLGKFPRCGFGDGESTPTGNFPVAIPSSTFVMFTQG